MGAGEVTLMESVEWDWFVSCTVSARGSSDIYLRKRAFAFLRLICRKQRRHFRFTPWVLRLESGVDPLHRHFHFLIGSLRTRSYGERMRMMAAYDHLVGSTSEVIRGTSRVRLYGGGRGLAAYLTGKLNEAEVRAWMAGDVMVSKAAWAIARRNARLWSPRRVA